MSSLYVPLHPFLVSLQYESRRGRRLYLRHYGNRVRVRRTLVVHIDRKCDTLVSISSSPYTVPGGGYGQTICRAGKTCTRESCCKQLYVIIMRFLVSWCCMRRSLWSDFFRYHILRCIHTHTHSLTHPPPPPTHYRKVSLTSYVHQCLGW